LSGRHERQLEQQRWLQTRRKEAEDARASAIGELTRHLAAGTHAMVWFTAAANMRAPLFAEQTIINYDSDMRTHLSAVVESLVAVASQDADAFRELEILAKRVWDLDGRLAELSKDYWDDREAVRARIASHLGETYDLQRGLPFEIVKVLQHRVPSTEVSGYVA
jgi:hypothetical protein